MNTPPHASVANTVRLLEPHIRMPHTRTVRGKAFPVRASIVNAEAARQQNRLAALSQVLQLSKQNAQCAANRSSASADAGHSPQVDFVVEFERAMKARGAQILDEGVSKYARLSMQESCHLAMARVRVSINEKADPQGLHPATEHIRADLSRLESLLFASSLTRLSAEDAAATRNVMWQRALGESGERSDRSVGEDEAHELQSAARPRG